MRNTFFQRLLIGSLLCLPAFAPLTAQAETSQEKGLRLIDEADKRDYGYVDLTAQMKMTLTDRLGKTSTRTIRMKMKEVENDGDKSLSLFDTPSTIKGTAMLTHTHAVKPDDQWMYLPRLKRVKRISSKNKSGPFMGSEFAFEDLGSQEVAKYTYNYLRDEVIDGRDSWVIERRPAYTHSGYTRQELWLDKERYQPNQVIYYDRKNSKLKTQSFKGYQQYIGQYWRPDVMLMVNHQTHKKTELQWIGYTFKNGFKDRDFHKNGLKRAR
ncbi:outer membrane lipoprotein-sorting protein [Magnetococcus sp. PR-3]|uniref:outer membrane lipoprotein-sorting protein n=1 Tax=Magnetococcus sp. PR-3 TaxID=3120355 RepID=UPI002FCE6487